MNKKFELIRKILDLAAQDGSLDDAVKALDEYVEGVDNGKWVNPKSSLPPYDTPVFVLLKSGNWDDFNIAEMNKGHEWDKIENDITHWQHLPKPPKN